MLNVNLAITPKERLLILVDKPTREELSRMTKEEIRKREDLLEIADTTYRLSKDTLSVAKVVYDAVGTHAAEPPPHVWKQTFGPSVYDYLTAHKSTFTRLLKKESLASGEMGGIVDCIKAHQDEVVDVVIVYSYYSTSHTSFRKLLTSWGKCRYASLPLFERSMFFAAMDVDWHKIAERTQKIASSLTAGAMVHVTTGAGTNLTLSIEGREGIADTGLIHRPGDFGNLPGGEAFIAPVEGTAQGTMVLFWGPTREFYSPVGMHVVNGMVKDVEGEDPYVKELRAKFGSVPLARNIAELGIGTNDGAKNPANILESEKILGTVHLACGDNSSFGGTVSVPYHQDFVIFDPTVMVADSHGQERLLLDEGELV